MSAIKQGGRLSWLLQRVTGAVLVVLLGYHFFLMHYKGEENIQFAAVQERLSSPQWKLFYVLFLIFGLYHGLNGLRSVLIDFDFWKDKDGVLKVLFLIIGVIAFYVGVRTVYSI